MEPERWFRPFVYLNFNVNRIACDRTSRGIKISMPFRFVQHIFRKYFNRVFAVFHPFRNFYHMDVTVTRQIIYLPICNNCSAFINQHG